MSPSISSSVSSNNVVPIQETTVKKMIIMNLPLNNHASRYTVVKV